MVFLLWRIIPLSGGLYSFPVSPGLQAGESKSKQRAKGPFITFDNMGRKLLCLNEFALFIPHPYSAISCCRIYLLPRRLKVWQCPLWAVSRVNLCFDSPWSSSFFFSFLPYHVAYGILAPQQGIEPMPLTWELRVLTSGPPRKSQDLLLEGLWDSSGQDLNWGGESQVSSWGLIFIYFTGPGWLNPVLQNMMLPLPSEEAWP